MALRAGTLPGLLARLEPWIVQVVGNALERKESPAHFTHHVMGEFAFVLEVASLAGGRGLAAFFVGVRQARIPVPFAAERLIHGAVLGQHVVFVDRKSTRMNSSH